MNFNQKLHDLIVAHTLGLERLKMGLARKYSDLLAKIDDRIKGLFVSLIGVKGAERAQITAKIKDIKNKQYDLVQSQYIDELVNLSDKQSAWLYGMFSTLLTPDMVTKSSVRLTSLENLDVRGLTLNKRFAKLRAADIDLLLSNAITAVNDSLTAQEAVATFNLLSKRRSNGLYTIIRTATAGASSIANDAFFQANESLINGMRLSVVFDNRTSPICIVHGNERKLYPIDNYPIPPLHWNCRTIAVPDVKTYAQLGASMRRKVPVSTRATMTGDFPGDATYSQWLKRQTKEIQNDALGVTRARLFRSGELTLDKFVDLTGKFYTVEQLFSKYDI